MKGMYYVRSPGRASAIEHGGQEMGVDPESVDEPVGIVLSRAQKSYRERLALDTALDAGVRLIPLAVVSVAPAAARSRASRFPYRRTAGAPASSYRCSERPH